MFENLEIALDELPDTDDLDWERLHPLYARALRIVAAIVLTIIAIATTVLAFILNLPLAPFVVLYSLLAIATAIAMIWPGISVQRQGYVVRDKDILFRKGVIWRSVTAIPFNRIQHVETSSTPIDRKFGLATLQLFTAGGSGGDLKIGGLGTTSPKSYASSFSTKPAPLLNTPEPETWRQDFAFRDFVLSRPDPAPHCKKCLAVTGTVVCPAGGLPG